MNTIRYKYLLEHDLFHEFKSNKLYLMLYKSLSLAKNAFAFLHKSKLKFGICYRLPQRLTNYLLKKTQSKQNLLSVIRLKKKKKTFFKIFSLRYPYYFIIKS
jgi:hypothetical protein